MSIHRHTIAASAATLLILAGGSLSLPDQKSPTEFTAPVLKEIEDETANPIGVSLFPNVSTRNSTPEQDRRLGEALERFRSAGLMLPNLMVEFHADGGPCGGHLGTFEQGSTTWRIVICADLDAVLEHELAHAWELANLQDGTRQRFMEYRGHEVWNDSAVPWNERGVEGAAFVIQQGLSGRSLPPTLSAENHRRLVAYSILTGQPAPRLLEWIGLDTNVPEVDGASF